MKERRDKGLCYNCDDKWALEHKCKKTKLFIMECEDSGDEEEVSYPPMLIEEWRSSLKQPCIEAHSLGLEPRIWIHALAGFPNPDYWFHSRCRNFDTCTGSAHNFIDPSVIAKARLQADHTPRFTIKVANGEAIHNKGFTKLVEFQM